MVKDPQKSKGSTRGRPTGAKLRVVLYVVSLASIAGMIAASLALYQSSLPKDRTFFVKDGELVRGPEARLLNPLLDIKIRILKDYPVEELTRTLDTGIQQITDLATLRSAYYNLFILSDWDEIKRLFSAIANNSSLQLQQNDQYIEAIVDILDSTLLVAAYLYDRLEMPEAASYYYSLYLDCLRGISFSSPGYIDRILGGGLMLSRVKYYYLKDYAQYLPPEYAKYSYVNQLLEYRLSWVLEHRFERYRRVIEAPSPGDLQLLNFIRNSDLRGVLYPTYERCLLLIRDSEWSEDAAQKVSQACPLGAPATRGDYLASFGAAAHIFLQVRRYSAEAENTGVSEPARLSEIEQAMKTFYRQHAKEAEFLVDDLKIKYAALLDNAEQRKRVICEVAAYRFPQYDFAPYARRLVRTEGLACD